MLIESLPEYPPEQGTAVALGNFDGVHRGHCSVIGLAADFSPQGLLPCVLSFSPHPYAVLKGAAPPTLITPSLRCAAYACAGAQAAFVLNFAEVCELSPQAFVEEILIRRLNARAVCCGFNYRFGKGGAGSVQTLREIGERDGIQVRVAPRAEFKGEAVSSTRIRVAVEAGHMRDAREMLGRPFAYDFTVTVGDRRGRLMGFPTINQKFPQGYALPRFGVYAGRALTEQGWKTAVVNVGVHPTFTLATPQSEAFLLDYSGDLYGKNITVELWEFLRGETKFSGAEELKRQIAADVSAARRIIEAESGVGAQ